MLATRGQSLEGMTVAVSGSGNVAQYSIQKVNQLGGRVVTVSDSDGSIYDKHGIHNEKLAWLMDLKNVRRGRIREYAQKFGAEYWEGKRPWGAKVDVALPSATQNEIDRSDAETLVQNGCLCVAEGANMPTTIEGVEVFQAAKILYGPGKAANAGGVATSGLEMSQNSMRLSWTREEVDARLQGIMRAIHKTCVDTMKEYGARDDYVLGANIGGFIKVADSMLDQGLV
jgi:glutamate dehydrogenase/leucine dehydrogenase